MGSLQIVCNYSLAINSIDNQQLVEQSGCNWAINDLTRQGDLDRMQSQIQPISGVEGAIER